jgi:hypothetical protein
MNNSFTAIFLAPFGVDQETDRRKLPHGRW